MLKWPKSGVIIKKPVNDKYGESYVNFINITWVIQELSYKNIYYSNELDQYEFFTKPTSINQSNKIGEININDKAVVWGLEYNIIDKNKYQRRNKGHFSFILSKPL